MIIRKLKGIFAVFLICAAFALIAFGTGRQLNIAKTNTNDIRYILDAGHGNPDGGTVGCDGSATEADINLAITQKLSAALKEKNISHQLTRNSEESIYSEGSTIHEKKVSDVRNRISIASDAPDVPLISIHMNSYPDPSVYGIQVFHGNGDAAEDLSKKLQDAFNQKIQPTHTKIAKAVSKNIYLFSHIDNPVILIECGFLSNPNELDKLKSQEYQQQLSDIIAEVLAAQS